MITVWLSADNTRALESDAGRHFPLETGGVLAGYTADNEDVVITAVIGAGPGAKHGRLRFEPDHEWQCTQLDDLYRDSRGSVVYLGDWHTHPTGVPSMSLLDKRTLQRIAGYRASRCKAPLMMIGGGDLGGWSWVAHQYRGRLLGLLAVTVARPLVVFEPAG